jgi:tripartite-type tricarboxylate transporter receptor subunit TctC
VLDTPLTMNQLPFDAERDLVPISLVATFSQMVVHPTVSANTLAQFVALAKTNSLTYGSGGARGNPGHLAMESLRKRTGFDLVHVTYKGNPQVVADLVGGHVQAGFLATPSVIGLVREGKLRGLAVSGPQRTPGAPDVPTVAEAGYPGFDIGFSLVMLAPARTPASIRAVLEKEVVQWVKSPDVQTRLRTQELEPVGTSGAEAENWLRTAAAKWKNVVQTAKVQLD